MIGTIAGAVAVLATAILGYLQWRTAKRTQDHEIEAAEIEQTVAMARSMDERINAHFTRLELAVGVAEAKIALLERRFDTLQHRFDRAVAYIRENGLPWPPPGEEELPP